VLCHFHIDKIVKKKCKIIIDSRELWDQVMESWGTIVDCDNVQAYEHCVQTF